MFKQNKTVYNTLIKIITKNTITL